MSSDELKPEPAALPEITLDLAKDGKAEIRTKVWDYLADHKLACFPWPPHKRVPNFKGAEIAGDQVSTMDIFSKAHCLKIDPDKPLQQMRIHTLEASKTLVVPTPRLRYGFLNKINPPPDSNKGTIRTCASKQCYSEFSSPVDLEAALHVDLVIVGAVAVSEKGLRIGKGDGFSDLEYAIMSSMSSITSTVPIVAVVHDCQVLNLPENIFGDHDVPVDYIVTPTRVITCEGRPTKPNGIIWSLLTAEKLSEIPILRKLRYHDLKAGIDVKLAGETEQPTELVDEVVKMDELEESKIWARQYRKNYKSRYNGRSNKYTNNSAQEEDGEPDARNECRQHNNRDAGDDHNTEGKTNRDGSRYNNGRGQGRGRWRRSRWSGARGSGSSNSREEMDHDGNDNKRDADYGGDDANDKENRSADRSHKTSEGGRDQRPRYRSYGRRATDKDIKWTKVFVGHLPRSLRVSHFKGEVRERKVNPLHVNWRGSAGFAFLNFKTKLEAEYALVALEGLHFNDRDIRVEMAKERVSGEAPAPRGRQQRRDSRSGGEDEGESADVKN